MNPLAQLFLARIREFYREPSALFWTYGFPILMALALGLAFKDGSGKAIPVAVVDGPFAAERVAILSADPGLIVKTVASENASWLGGGMLLEIGGEEQLVYRFDPTHPDTPWRPNARLMTCCSEPPAGVTQCQPRTSLCKPEAQDTSIF